MCNRGDDTKGVAPRRPNSAEGRQPNACRETRVPATVRRRSERAKKRRASYLGFELMCPLPSALAAGRDERLTGTGCNRSLPFGACAPSETTPHSGELRIDHPSARNSGAGGVHQGRGMPGGATLGPHFGSDTPAKRRYQACNSCLAKEVGNPRVVSSQLCPAGSQRSRRIPWLVVGGTASGIQGRLLGGACLTSWGSSAACQRSRRMFA